MAKGGIKSKLLASQFWKATAPPGAESIALTDFVQTLGVLQRGSSEERLKLTFTLLDVDGDGFLSRQELGSVMQEVQAMCGQLVTYNGRVFASAEAFSDYFFAQLDEKQTGKVSFEDYQNHAYKNLDIISTLSLFGGSSMPTGAVYSPSPSFGPRESIIS